MSTGKPENMNRSRRGCCRAVLSGHLSRYILLSLFATYKTGLSLEVALSSHEVYVGEVFSVSCRLNSSLAGVLTKDHIEGSWRQSSEDLQNGDLDVVSKSVVMSQGAYLMFLHLTGEASDNRSSTLAAFSLTSKQGYFCEELQCEVFYSLSRDEEDMLNVTLTITQADYDAFGRYQCLVYAHGEVVYSHQEHLTVSGPPQISGVSSSPRSAMLGFPVTLGCKFSSYPQPTRVSWLRGDGRPTVGNTRLKNGDDGAAAWKSQLALDVLEPALLGVHTCVVENRHGNDSQTFYLSVQSTVKLEMLDRETWTRERGDKAYRYSFQAGEDRAIRAECIAANMDVSEFRVGQISNEEGTESVSTNPVQFLGKSSSKFKTILWSLRTDNQYRLPRMWPGNSSVSIRSSISGSGDARYVSSILTIKNIDYSLAALLECSIPDRNVILREFVLITIEGPPIITTAPLSMVSSVNATVTLTCEVTAKPEPALSDSFWVYNGLRISDGDRHISELRLSPVAPAHSLATPVYLLTLTISQVMPQDVGEYTCQAGNAHGQASKQMSLDLCSQGFRPDAEGLTCTDVDECATTPALCDFRCININGSYICSCPDNFRLASEGRSCDFSDSETSVGASPKNSAIVPILAGVVTTIVLVLLAAALAYGVRWRRKRAVRDSIMRALHEKTKRNHGNIRFTNSTCSSTMSISGEFPRERVKLLDVVGEGKFGQVWSAEALNVIGTGQWELIAVKMCKESASDADKLDFLNEVSLVSKIPRHLNVVNYLGCCTQQEPALLIMEYITGGDLLGLLRKNRKFQLYADPPDIDTHSMLPSAEKAELRHTDTAMWAKMAQEMSFTNMSFEPDSPITIEAVSTFKSSDNNDDKQSDGDRSFDLRFEKENFTTYVNTPLPGKIEPACRQTIVRQDQSRTSSESLQTNESIVTVYRATNELSRSKEPLETQSKEPLAISLKDPLAKPDGAFRSTFRQENEMVKSNQRNLTNSSPKRLDSTVPEESNKFRSIIEITNNSPSSIKKTLDTDKKQSCGATNQEEEVEDLSVDLTNQAVRKSSNASSGNSQTAFLSSSSREAKKTKRYPRRASLFSLRRKTLTSDAVSVASCSPTRHRKLKHTRKGQQFGWETFDSSSAQNISGVDPGDMSSHTESDDNEYHDDLVDDENDNEDISSGKLFAFALQIARGMRHLAESKIIHRDLAARNVLVTDKGVCKITDFGLARPVDGSDCYERTSKGALPIRWMPPEALADGSHSSKSDVWAYGVLLWEIVTLGASPYPGLSARDVFRWVNSGRTMDRPDHCSPDLYELMTDCWSFLPATRPDFSHVCCKLEELLEREEDYIMLDQFQSDHYTYIEPDSLDEKL